MSDKLSEIKEALGPPDPSLKSWVWPAMHWLVSEVERLQKYVDVILVETDEINSKYVNDILRLTQENRNLTKRCDAAWSTIQMAERYANTTGYWTMAAKCREWLEGSHEQPERDQTADAI